MHSSKCRAHPNVSDPGECGQGEAGQGAVVEAVKAQLGLERLESFRVVHCAHAFGCALHSSDGWRLALSGDTRPCNAVVAAARDATVLIHEART
jgi:ribonuclease Z